MEPSAVHDGPAYTLDFAGSEVSRVQVDREWLRVAFSAARVQTGDLPVRTGHVRSLQMVLAWSGSPPASPGDCLGALASGTLDIAGQTPSPLRVPCELRGHCRLELDFVNGTHLSVTGRSAVFRFTGEPRFVEDLSC